MSEVENDEIGLIVGLEVNVANNLYKTVADVKQAGYNFVVTHMVHPQMKGELSAGHLRSYHPKFVARSEDSIATNDWAILVASKVSKWIDVDSSFPYVRINSEKALNNEIEYSNYLGIEVVVVSLRSQNCVNLAKCLMKKTPAITHRASQCVWASVPMTDSKQDCNKFFNESPQDCDQLDNMNCTWKWWNALRSITWEHKVYLALELTNTSTTLEMRRWYCEPIQALLIHKSLFQTDNNGLPILSSILQTFIQTVWNLNESVRIVITGSHVHGDIKLYRQHLLHLYKNTHFTCAVNISGPRNDDRVQLPIQPLKDTLDVYIYELFEDDVVKYMNYYNKAICWALVDTVPDNEESDRRINILIVGAGRGHMATVVLLAADEVARDVHVVVYERNCNVHPSLHYRKQHSWKGRVEINCQDIENWDTSEKFDIIVLDSVGVAVENELYPENLGKAKKFLKEGGIMIPSSCTKFLAPVSAPRFYLELNSTDCSLKRFETPYLVVSPNRSTLVSPLPLFKFNFPSNEKPLDNSRYSILKFKADCDFMLHGFLTFFEAVLYKDIKLSIHPDHHLEDGEFYSWMPLYFPIRVPIYINESDSIEVHFWRCVNDSGDEVWYEWSVAKPQTSAIHNPDGRSHKMI